MKKFLFSLFILMVSSIAVNAETMTGIALSEFSTNSPQEYFTVKINESFIIDNMKKYEEGTIFYGRVTKVVDGQRGKRKGYFVFIPTHYATKEGVHKFSVTHMEIKVSYYKPFDKKQAVKNISGAGITTAASHIFHVPMLSQGISFIKGSVIDPEEDGNRIVSGVKRVYQDSPLSYVEKGESLVIHQGQEVKLNINE
ncbi:hypothetical protein IJG14_01475 [bacterium]|nr:hypothetical protein [bacterium]